MTESTSAQTETAPAQTVAIIGASRDRRKFGNIALRAYRDRGWTVYPVHPSEATIEGLTVFPRIRDVPTRPNRVLLYLPPTVGVTVLADIAARGTDQLWVNPGAESDELIRRAEQLGLSPILACSIVALGLRPTDFPTE